jgi:hypothetical protein
MSRLGPQKALRSPQILKLQLQAGISAMVSSAEMALREVKNQRSWKRHVFSGRIAYRFRSSIPHRFEIS